MSAFLWICAIASGVSMFAAFARQDGLGVWGYLALTIVLALLSRLAKKVKEQNKTGKPKSAKAAFNQAADEIAKAITKELKADSAADELAERLRAFATNYEDLTKHEILVQQGLHIRRTTKATSVIGRCDFVVQRNQVSIRFRNQKTGTVKNLEKSWQQVIGCLPNAYELYFRDDTMVEFMPYEDKLFFDIVWQILSSPMNGADYLLREPAASGIGAQVRAIATHIQENPAIAKQGKLDISGIKGAEEVTDWDAMMPEKVAPPKIGDVVGGFKLTKQLGEGGFGAVFQAESTTKPGELAAVKIMKTPAEVKPGSTAFHTMTDNFLAEAKISLNYKHVPFMVTAYNYSPSPWPWITYPLVEGRTLMDFVQEGRVIQKDLWWNLAHDVLSGLSEMHDDGAVHRDIKCDNIMYTKECFQILDLGISQFSDYLRPGQRQAAHGARRFVSPEVLALQSSAKVTPEQVGAITPAADIYGLGLVLYMVRTGELPYQFKGQGWTSENELAARKAAHIDESMFDADEIELVTRMLAFEKQDRITTSDALKLVAPHVELEPKILLMEQAREEQYKHKASEKRNVNAPDENFEIKGPFKSWKKMEDAVKEIMEFKRPRYFIWELQFEDRDLVYCQAYFDGDGWAVECLSEEFSDTKHSDSQKRTFMDLGWNPPNEESPNYQRDVLTLEAKVSLAHMVDAFERGHNVRPSDVSKALFTVVDLGHF